LAIEAVHLVGEFLADQHEVVVLRVFTKRLRSRFGGRETRR
jgi:hypothetical protein